MTRRREEKRRKRRETLLREGGAGIASIQGSVSGGDSSWAKRMRKSVFKKRKFHVPKLMRDVDDEDKEDEEDQEGLEGKVEAKEFESPFSL